MVRNAGIAREPAPSPQVPGIGVQGIRSQSFFETAEVEEIANGACQRAGLVVLRAAIGLVVHRANDTISAKMFETNCA